MVSIIEDFKNRFVKLKDQYLTSYNLECYCYAYLLKHSNDKVEQTIIEKLVKYLDYHQDEEKVAAIGYLHSIDPNLVKNYHGDLESELKRVLNTQPYGGMHYSTNIFTLLGIYLLAKTLNQHDSQLEQHITQILQKENLRDKFLVLFPSKKFDDFIELKNCRSAIDYCIYALVKSYSSLELDQQQKIAELVTKNWQEFLRSNVDLIDIFFIEQFISESLKQKLRFKEYDAVTLIENILSNFHNAVTKITRNRRKDHQEFRINDEYDTQDLIYVILKPIFPDLTEEEPTPKTGGKVSIIDFIIPSERIGFEIKYLFDYDKNEKKLIDSLKKDIQSYYKYPYLDHFIIFINDPFHKTKDKNNFHDLEGSQTIKGYTFEVKAIVKP